MQSLLKQIRELHAGQHSRQLLEPVDSQQNSLDWSDDTLFQPKINTKAPKLDLDNQPDYRRDPDYENYKKQLREQLDLKLAMISQL